jgi:hypothetical protein
MNGRDRQREGDIIDLIRAVHEDLTTLRASPNLGIRIWRREPHTVVPHRRSAPLPRELVHYFSHHSMQNNVSAMRNMIGGYMVSIIRATTIPACAKRNRGGPKLG